MEEEEGSRKRRKGNEDAMVLNTISDQELAENHLQDQMLAADDDDARGSEAKRDRENMSEGVRRREERERKERQFQQGRKGTVSKSTSKKRVVVFYTHKGGVGKTTCLLSMAVKASRYKRVLVIDCDPQMNASHFFSRWCGPHFDFDQFYTDMVEHHRLRKKAPHDLSDDERTWLEIHSNSLKGRNIYDVLKDGFQPGRHDEECLSEFAELGFNISLSENSGITLVASHPMLIEFEENIGDEDRRGSRSPDYSTRLRRFCDYMLNNAGFDVVFLDLSPSSSFLNQIAIILSDLLIMPCSADEFAHYAIRTLGMWLETWHSRHRSLLDFRHHPGVKLLTVVYNRYKVYGARDTQAPVVMNGKRYYPSTTHKDYIEKLTDIRNGALLDGSLKKFKVFPESREIPLIRDGLSSMARLQMFALTPYDDIKRTGLRSNGIITLIREEYDVLWGLLRDALGWQNVDVVDEI